MDEDITGTKEGACGYWREGLSSLRKQPVQRPPGGRGAVFQEGCVAQWIEQGVCVGAGFHWEMKLLEGFEQRREVL